MNIPIPAETPDPNLDQPPLPPSDPPVPEQEPPATPAPPKGDPPANRPPLELQA
ncbi:hypothetical protein GGD92_03360 [Pseudomonas protegens]|uniref:Uncharacterized protein n=1 Tax=Pseudomonas protegens TaxID=380021 RepID=A0A7G8YNT1_9PSED|nr:hypothetical protein [Pseudomonas protegens]QNH77329.1 hypothetical protein GGI48_29495 [Pseudomonas protegens]QNL06525.1 hypothetical protein GGD92_03360 [Pseudomonas protegens]